MRESPRSIYYESLVDDPETVVDLISGMLFDDATKAKVPHLRREMPRCLRDCRGLR